VAAIAVLAGCTSTVDGTADRLKDAGPVRDLLTVLPDAAEVSRAVGNPLADNGSPVSGGIDVLPNGIRDDSAASPIECLGAVSPFMRVVYEGGDVRATAWQEFVNYGGGQAVSGVNAGVVAFASEGEAQRMFNEFAARWKACEGTTLTTALHDPANTVLYQQLTAVSVDGPVVSATVVNSDNQGDATFPTERAMGLAADCVVDVDVAVTAGPPAQKRAAGRAAGLVKAMLDKVNRG
jgi:PknH-like extracellular domain